MMFTPAAAAAGGSGMSPVPRRTYFRSTKLLLLFLLGFTVQTTACGTADDDVGIIATAHGSAHQGGSRNNNIGLLAADYYHPSGLRGKHVAGAPAPLTRMPGEEDPTTTATTTTFSTPMTAHHTREKMSSADQDMGRHPLVTGGSGEDDSQAATARRTEEDSLDITKATLKKIDVVIVLQDEGIIYCPIPKVSSSEWKRSLRWMVGVVDYDKYDGKTHSKQNGLSLLASRGLKETQWALETDRFYRFVVVREPAERLVSAFLGKCVKQGYNNSGHLTKTGAPNCPYLTAMPELFPGTKRASPATHARLKELVETDPEGTFYHFVNGIWRQAKKHGDTCKSWDAHHRPQACFCDLPNLLSAFHVIPISNLSAEAEALAGRLPAALPESGGGVGLETVGVGGAEGVTARGRRTGVSDARREEIHQFLKGRFTVFHEVSHQGTQADQEKENFLSEPVLELIHQMYKADYDLLGDYF